MPSPMFGQSLAGYCFLPMQVFVTVLSGASEFIFRLARLGLEIAKSCAFRRIAANSCAPDLQGKFWLAKVGVEDSNPFVRSSFLKEIRAIRRPFEAALLLTRSRRRECK
jgi:hypothetical protein